MKKAFLSIVLGCLLLIPFKVNAECKVADMIRLQKLANNISISYEYQETIDKTGYGSTRFTVTILNMHNELYLLDTSSNKIFKNNEVHGEIIDTQDGLVIPPVEMEEGANTIKIKGVFAGISELYDIYANSGACKREKISSFYVRTPDYNPYYTDAVCKTIPNYSLCNKWAKVDYSQEQFRNVINKHLDSLKKKPIIDEPVEKEKSIWTKILIFLGDNIIILWGAGILLIGIISMVFYMKKKKEFDLKI